MRRIVRLPAPASYEPTLTVAPRPGNALDTLLGRGLPVRVDASSRAVRDVRASAYAAIDGDAETTWVAAADDVRPTLGIRWPGRRSVTGLDLSVDPDTAARRPEVVVLSWPGGRRSVRLDAQGRSRFAAIRTDRLTIRVEKAERVASLGFDGSITPVGVGISELRLRGGPELPAAVSSEPVSYACGTGPDVSVNGRTYRTSVTARAADLVAMAPSTAQLCGGPTLTLRRGESAVDVLSSPAFAPDALVLRRTGDIALSTLAAARGAPLIDDSPVHRRIHVAAGSRLLAVRENVNPGWRASMGDVGLRPVTVDGWQQGFELSGRVGAVTESFAPDHPYRLGLGIGLVLLVGLAALTLVSGRTVADRSPPALDAREIGPRVVLAAGLIGAGLLAGWTGVVVAAATAALVLLLHERAPQAVRWAVGGASLVASLAYVLRPWGSPSGWAGHLDTPHYLVLASVVGVLVLSAPPLPRRPRARSRIAGRSTRR
jgi:arabinofuranan 3-O-arabinosyltransferase